MPEKERGRNLDDETEITVTTRLPFAQPGRFWKGNLHTHSTRSDGKLTPAEVMAAYRGRGYDFLALTDHLMERFGWPIVDTTAYRTPSFTTLIGAEVHAGALSHGDRWHLLAVGLPLDFAPPPPEETAPELAARAAASGAFIGIAHPAWHALTGYIARPISMPAPTPPVSPSSIEASRSRFPCPLRRCGLVLGWMVVKRASRGH